MPEPRPSVARIIRWPEELWLMVQQAAALEDLTAAQLARRELRRSATDIIKRHKKGKAQ